MNPDLNVDTVTPAPPLKCLLLAVVAPFGAVALLATPLLVTTLRHAVGL
jgi:hypothetical protein